MNSSILKFGSFLAILIGLLILPNSLKYHHQDLLIFMVINILVAVSYRLMTLTGEWSLLHVVMGVLSIASMANIFAVWLTSSAKLEVSVKALIQKQRLLARRFSIFFKLSLKPSTTLEATLYGIATRICSKTRNP